MPHIWRYEDVGCAIVQMGIFTTCFAFEVYWVVLFSCITLRIEETSLINRM
jgi:hypothetical protein